MVLYFKSAVSSPRRSRSISPTHRRPYSGRWKQFDFGRSDYMGSMGSLNGSARTLRKFPSLSSLPIKDIKILKAIARKKEDEIIRQELAEKFHDLWSQEKNTRQQLESEVESRYQKFVQDKREWERQLYEQRQLQRDMDQRLERSRLAQGIQDKDEKSAHLLEQLEDEKMSQLLSRQVEDAARRRYAALRRSSMEQAEERRRRTEAVEQQRRADAAKYRRLAMLRDASQRIAITNSICQLESARLQHEAAIADFLRHEQLCSAISEKDARMRDRVRARQDALRRSRRTAYVTASLREALQRC